MQLKISMNWTTVADFDIAAVYESKEGQRGLIYFGDLGKKDSFPYIYLNKDAGVDNKGGNKAEDLVINKFNEMKSVWLFCWDYQSVENGTKGRFKDSDVRLTIENNSGKEQNLAITSKMPNDGNVCYFGKILNTDKGIKIKNSAVDGLLRGLKSVEQLMALVRYEEAQVA